jgi:hypothetical protein
LVPPGGREQPVSPRWVQKLERHAGAWWYSTLVWISSGWVRVLWAIWLSMDDRGSRATPARLPRRRRRWRRPHLAGPHLAALVGALALAVGVAACAGGGNTTSGVASLNGAGKPPPPPAPAGVDPVL